MTRRSFFGWLLCQLGFHDNQEWVAGDLVEDVLPGGEVRSAERVWRSSCARPGCWEVAEYWKPVAYVEPWEVAEFIKRKARERDPE